MARISDTTGTLMAGSYYDKKCAIGLILGELPPLDREAYIASINFEDLST